MMLACIANVFNSITLLYIVHSSQVIFSFGLFS